MVTSSKSPDRLSLVELLAHELASTPDAELLAEVDGEAERAAGLKILDAAKVAAGRQRLAAARAGVRAQEQAPKEAFQRVSVAEARAFVQAASNDARYTLAARQLGEMSDDEVIDLYAQLKLLEDSKTARKTEE